MLVEAVEIIRMLWQGDRQTYYGTYYTLENARIYTLPDELPPIMVAASGPKSAGLAGEIGDGLISTAPEAEMVERFDGNGSKERPHYGQTTVCCAQDEAKARQTARKYWPNAALHGELSQELPTPAHLLSRRFST